MHNYNTLLILKEESAIIVDLTLISQLQINNREQEENNNKNNKNCCKNIWDQVKYVFIKLLEIFLCKKCKCKCKFRDKNKLLSKAENIINDKLDIISYIKNMIILDTFHFDVNNNMKIIYKLLSMPVISSDNYDYDDDEMSKKSTISMVHNRCLSIQDIIDFPQIYENLLKIGDTRVIKFVNDRLKEILNII